MLVPIGKRSWELKRTPETAAEEDDDEDGDEKEEQEQEREQGGERGGKRGGEADTQQVPEPDVEEQGKFTDPETP